MKFLTGLLLPIMMVGCTTQSEQVVVAENDSKKSAIDIDKSLGAVCGTDSKIAMMAIDLRDKGKSRDYLQQAVNAIPESQLRKKRIMNSALEDVYTYPELSKEAYMMYRLEACYFQVSGKNVPEFLTKDMASYLIKCESIEEQKAKYLCVSAVAKNSSF